MARNNQPTDRRLYPMDNPFDAIMHELQDIKQQLADLKQPRLPKQEKMLSRKEAAAMIGVSLPTLLSLVRSGTLPAIRLRRKVSFRESDVLSVRQGKR